MADDIDVDDMLENFLEAPESRELEPEDKAGNVGQKKTNREKSRSRSRDRRKSDRRSRSRKKSSRKSQERSRKRSRSRKSSRSRRDRSRSKKKRSRSRDRKRRSKSKDRKRKKSRSRSPRKPKKRSRTKSRSIDRMNRKRTPSPKDKASIEERDSRTVLAMQLSQKTKERDLKDFFSAVGDVKAVKLIQSLSKKRQKNIGIAYIEFKYTQSVPLAIGLSGQMLNGVPIIVQQSLAEKNRHAQMMEVTRQNLSKLGTGPAKLKVANLPEELNEDMVRQIFDPFGTIESCLLIRDPITQKFTGSGFITFTESECGKAAMRELDRFDLAGNRLRVSIVDGVGSRDRRKSRSRSRSRERRREDDRSDPDPANGAVGRIALMNKLAHRDGISGVPKPASKESKPAPPVQPIETACFQLSNMFDPSKETGDSWHEDIRSDVISELSSYGGAVHVYVDKHSKDGVVYVKAYTRDSAMLATKAMHGKYFDGKMIQAAYIPEVNYLELFPAAADQKTPLNLDSV